MTPRALAFSCLLLAASMGFAQEQIYRSNSAGMLLEKIAAYRRDESAWIMDVHRSGAAEVRTLLDHGKEVRRWEISPSGGQTVERELVSGVLAARRVYDSSGSVLQEERYEAGALSRKTLYSYAGGRLLRTRTLDPSGTTLYSDQYLYASGGSLRAVRRTPSGGEAQSASLVTGAGGIFEERTDTGETLLISRYDSKGRVTSRERRTGGVTVSREDFLFRAGTGVLESSTERLPGEHTVIQRRYDEAGRLLQETTTGPSGKPAVVSMVRDDKGRVVSRSSRGAAGLEVWNYSLRDDGSVSREEYSRRGSREKVTIYGEGGQRTEEFYRDGEIFLRVFFDGDLRVREEVVSDGTLVRTRSYP